MVRVALGPIFLGNNQYPAVPRQAQGRHQARDPAAYHEIVCIHRFHEAAMFGLHPGIVNFLFFSDKRSHLQYYLPQ